MLSDTFVLFIFCTSRNTFVCKIEHFKLTNVLLTVHILTDYKHHIISPDFKLSHLLAHSNL